MSLLSIWTYVATGWTHLAIGLRKSSDNYREAHFFDHVLLPPETLLHRAAYRLEKYIRKSGDHSADSPAFIHLCALMRRTFLSEENIVLQLEAAAMVQRIIPQLGNGVSSHKLLELASQATSVFVRLSMINFILEWKAQEAQNRGRVIEMPEEQPQCPVMHPMVRVPDLTIPSV